MIRLKGAFAYMVAVLMTFVALAALMGGTFLAAKLVNATGVKVSPWYTGGEVVQTIDHGSYRTLIHRPVFDTLVGQKKDGFIQIDWEPLGALPEKISEDIACFGNSNKDFHINLDTKTNVAELTSYNPEVISLAGSYKLKERMAVRVVLCRE
ncbi:MAG: hypothetical protein H6Q73_290 [Firmicutes bacterium]|nr:hypothetical protein [Bacillota bacterium]